MLDLEFEGEFAGAAVETSHLTHFTLKVDAIEGLPCAVRAALLAPTR